MQKENEIIILSIDLGKNIGAVCMKGEATLFKEHLVFDGLLWLRNKVDLIIHELKPDVILIPFPTRFYYTMIAHAKMMGVICMLAEDYGVTVIEVNDSTCKKTVLGSGKAKKPEIMKHFNEENEHCADALMFIEWFKTTQ